ncbi:MAG: alpha-amylase family protein [Streptosporangiaceae bacterium]
MRTTVTSDLWWKNAVVYCLDVEKFADGNGDGVGDFQGLAQRIDHLARLGVTCIWLMPFFPTPGRDDGYDISDFYSVDPRLGTLGDFVEFMRSARDRGIRVIADLVLNHTSDQHPWFVDARSGKDSAYRDWYIWNDTPEPDDKAGVVFPDVEDSLWEYDEGSGQYYYHRFYKEQPDLNTANPEVRDETARILGFWMELGLSGFRVDAVPFLVEDVSEELRSALPDPHDYLRDMRAFMNRRSGDAVLLGEVNLEYPDLLRYFGDDNGDEVTMCFDFIAMQRFHLSMARQDGRALAEALRERPKPPKDSQWAVFVRNHDELTLDKLSESERQEVFAAFGPDKDMQVYGRGLRRRLPPMLENDLPRLKMAYSLMFALPGTPVLFYGEEIGLGEDLSLEGRMAVRIPMDWAAVQDQRHTPDSLMTWITKMVMVYRECPELAWGDYEVLDLGDTALFGLRSQAEGHCVITVHNLADRAADTVLAVPAGQAELTDLLTSTAVEVDADGNLPLRLEPYGTCWLRTTG